MGCAQDFDEDTTVFFAAALPDSLRSLEIGKKGPETKDGEATAK